jgi:predicted DNA-binding ribbon-helix-helix protein
MKSSVIKRSINIDGHKTSITLEDDFWNSLREIADSRGETLSHLVLTSIQSANSPISHQPFGSLCLASIEISSTAAANISSLRFFKQAWPD